MPADAIANRLAVRDGEAHRIPMHASYASAGVDCGCILAVVGEQPL
jgi:hypothetical protein